MKDGQREKENRTFPDASAASAATAAITNHFKRRTKAGAIFAAAVTTLWFYHGSLEKFNTLEDFLSLIRI